MDSRGGGGVKNDAVYWIWLSRGLGVASTAARIVLEKGLDAKALYQMDLTALDSARTACAAPVAKSSRLCR